MIDRFSGEHAFLSNFYPVEVWRARIRYPSVEHAYQAAKTSDVFAKRRIAACATAAQAKREGRKVVLKAQWEIIRVPVMATLLRRKFQHSELRELLLSTGDEELVEGNYWNDTFWGVCRGQGHNILGKLLMQVRAEIRGSVVDAYLNL